jgi:hypothetical protein
MFNWIQADILSKTTLMRNLLPEYLAPMILVIFNSVIIPLLVDLVAFLQDHETQSGKQVTIMIVNFVFMSVNSIFIPLTNYITMKQFLDFVLESIQT